MALDSRRRLTDHVKTAMACGTYRAGDKLPSLRVFAEQFGLTLSTARNALLDLAGAGLVELRHGDGIYVAAAGNGEAEKVGCRIAVFMDRAVSMDPGSSYCANALLGLQEEAARRGCRVEMQFREFYDRRHPTVITEWEVKGCNAIALLGSFDWRELILPPGIPVVGCSMADCAGGRISCVDLDPLYAAQLAVDFFRRRGIGSRLLDAAGAWAKQRGARRLQLNCDDQNLPAMRFYEARNWIRTHLFNYFKFNF